MTSQATKRRSDEATKGVRDVGGSASIERLADAFTRFAVCAALGLVSAVWGLVLDANGQDLPCVILVGFAGGCGLGCVGLLRTIQRREREIFSISPRHEPSPDPALNPAMATFEAFDFGVFPSRFDPQYNPSSHRFQDEYPAPGGADRQSVKAVQRSAPEDTPASGFGLPGGRI